MRFSAECVRAKTMSSRFIRVRTPSPLPTSIRISTGHKRAWSKIDRKSTRLLFRSHDILRRMREGKNHVEPVHSRPHAIAVADQHPHLNRAQKSVVEDVLSSPDRVQGIQGFAGAGKTTTLIVLRSAAEGQGYQVEGFAPDRKSVV